MMYLAPGYWLFPRLTRSCMLNKAKVSAEKILYLINIQACPVTFGYAPGNMFAVVLLCCSQNSNALVNPHRMRNNNVQNLYYTLFLDSYPYLSMLKGVTISGNVRFWAIVLGTPT